MLLLALLAALSGDPAPVAASAAPGPAASAAPPRTAAADPNATICKSTMVTGTHFPERVCHTRAEWDQMTADSRSSTQDTQRAMGIPR